MEEKGCRSNAKANIVLVVKREQIHKSERDKNKTKVLTEKKQMQEQKQGNNV